ncbi:1-acylglycerol-3-phosphate acyltransferase, putative [Entamoeba invadens IP1]|uniref:1-acylglycerol-3-phosphate acyltransferase, putative n=1 Tax=Entamoeba invadens IP1 TaxID=370355 RepID=A0A0A1U2I8_ENTIV|nr:1-acylglycerol-3-phosphate acyltransferase, putative [Entamoeba invadens IP1]ELP88277.1 1-acylglycerol-3-phosphate acyltransferase, putative [Entamoeba invadens IP1]|eukprot:XP_004255048.1 1-acylglycerol-3-phosphate acyltransferase, putative [Entamoeba invadens IP1]
MDLKQVFGKIVFVLKLYYAYGFLMSVFLQITILLIMNLIVSPMYFINRSIYQWIFQRFTEVYMCYFSIHCYYINGNKLLYSGDDLIANENQIWVQNHTHWFDFAPICMLSPMVGRIGSMRFFIKDEIMKLPFIGFGLYWMDNIMLKRNFADDEKHINETFKRLRNKYYPFLLIIFPEGTRAKPERILESQKYAKEHGLHVYKNLLNPRPLGLFHALKQLKKVTPYLYDLTTGYGPGASLGVVFCPGDGVDIHVHGKRYLTKDLPDDFEEFKKWMEKIWIEKDELVDYFNENKKFPGNEKQLPFTFKWADFTGYMEPGCFDKP